jgi:hypothetical protein
MSPHVLYDVARVPLPPTIRVKVSSEAAEQISLSPVVAQDMYPEELVALIVSGTGKDQARIREVLHRGSFVSGASRFRWERLHISEEEMARLVASFPDPDPKRPFDSGACVQMILRGPAAQIVIDRLSAQRKRLFRRRSLWDEIIDLSSGVVYAGYSYKERADLYRVVLDPDRQKQLRAAAQLSPYSSISHQIRSLLLDSVEFFVKR